MIGWFPFIYVVPFRYAKCIPPPNPSIFLFDGLGVEIHLSGGLTEMNRDHPDLLQAKDHVKIVFGVT